MTMEPERSRGSSQRDPAANRHVVFLIGTRRMSLPITVVREVVDLRQVTPVPLAPATVLGIISLRGTILSVLDTERVLSGGSTRAPSKVLVLFRDDQAVCGLAVNEVAAVTAMPNARYLQNRLATPEPLVAGYRDPGDGELVASLDEQALLRRIDAQRFSPTAAHLPPIPEQETPR